MRASIRAIDFAILTLTVRCSAQEFHPAIPRAWDDKAVEALEVPLPQRDRSPRYMSAEEYYKLKVRPIYRSYPAYAKGREPAGYLEALKQKDPEIIFDPSKLHTQEDWIAAGKLVFESDTRFFPAGEPPAEGDVLVPVSKDGMLPGFGFRYYIRKKGVLEGGTNGCSGCHTRVMPDGSFWEGAQGAPGPPTKSAVLRATQANPDQVRRRLDGFWIAFGIPWVMSRKEFEAQNTAEEFALVLAALRPGVFARQDTSFSHPPHVPSLIGVQDRKYLDATGLVRNHSIGDLMRYAILNSGLDTLAHFGDFQPTPVAAVFSGDAGTRYSDEQLYALAARV